MTVTVTIYDKVNKHNHVIEELLRELGWWHKYYALSALESGVAQVAVLNIDHRVAGCEIFYKTTIGDSKFCVHYYVVVDRNLRGKGYGKILVSSVEEYCGDVEAYIATIAEYNIPSIRMFKSLNYELFTWDEIDEIKTGLSYVFMKATCGYEDDFICIKTVDKPVESFLKSLEPIKGDYTRIWKKICYKPWARLRNYF